MIHYDDSSRDDWAVEWFSDPRCTNGYTWLVLDDGRVIELADPAMRTPHAGPCVTKNANSAYYGIAAATNGKTLATPAQMQAIVECVRAVWAFHNWPADERGHVHRRPRCAGRLDCAPIRTTARCGEESAERSIPPERAATVFQSSTFQPSKNKSRGGCHDTTHAGGDRAVDRRAWSGSRSRQPRANGELAGRFASDSMEAARDTTHEVEIAALHDSVRVFVRRAEQQEQRADGLDRALGARAAGVAQRAGADCGARYRRPHRHRARRRGQRPAVAIRGAGSAVHSGRRSGAAVPGV